jgi:hypothetical protein
MITRTNNRECHCIPKRCLETSVNDKTYVACGTGLCNNRLLKSCFASDPICETCSIINDVESAETGRESMPASVSVIRDDDEEAYMHEYTNPEMFQKKLEEMAIDSPPDASEMAPEPATVESVQQAAVSQAAKDVHEFLAMRNDPTDAVDFSSDASEMEAESTTVESAQQVAAAQVAKDVQSNEKRPAEFRDAVMCIDDTDNCDGRFKSGSSSAISLLTDDDDAEAKPRVINDAQEQTSEVAVPDSLKRLSEIPETSVESDDELEEITEDEPSSKHANCNSMLTVHNVECPDKDIVTITTKFSSDTTQETFFLTRRFKLYSFSKKNLSVLKPKFYTELKADGDPYKEERLYQWCVGRLTVINKKMFVSMTELVDDNDKPTGFMIVRCLMSMCAKPVFAFILCHLQTLKADGNLAFKLIVYNSENDSKELFHRCLSY